MSNGSPVPPRRVTVTRGHQVLLSFDGRSVSIGRGAGCDIQLIDPHVSLRHGEILVSDEGVVYHDLESRNGSEIRRGPRTIRVDGSTGHRCQLANGDRLRLGNPLEPIELAIAVEGLAAAGPPVEPEDRFLSDTTVTVIGRSGDMDSIRRRVNDDMRALQCLYSLLGRLAVVRDRDALLREVSGIIFQAFDRATHVTVYMRPRPATVPSDLVPARPEGRLTADQFTPVLAMTRGGPDPAPLPLNPEVMARLADSGEGLLVEEPHQEDGNGGRTSVPAPQSGLCVPLSDRSGIRGVLQVDSRVSAGAFEARDLDLATLVGGHVALVLANLDLYEDLTRVNQDLRDALMRVRLLDTARDHLSRFVPEAVRREVSESPATPQLDMQDAIATILFLDIGGYTKLTEQLGRDEVSFLVERYFSGFIDDIYRNRGDINETAGDGLMIIFRAGQPREHARDAVRAAMAIRRKTTAINSELAGQSRPIDVNMGVNTGPVLLGSRRIRGVAGARWTYTATGMATNVCARLAAHAVRGQILIGPETAAHVRGVAALRELGPVQFKNVAQPLPVFEVLVEGDTRELPNRD
jgi:class 3 adenylate cyclase